jgi:hypothetical protein
MSQTIWQNIKFYRGHYFLAFVHWQLARTFCCFLSAFSVEQDYFPQNKNKWYKIRLGLITSFPMHYDFLSTVKVRMKKIRVLVVCLDFRWKNLHVTK